MSNIFEKIGIIVTGAFIGILSVFLVIWGNPGNMGFCTASFLRDIAGGLGFHNAIEFQYVRPEILGLIIGAIIGSIISVNIEVGIVRKLFGIFLIFIAIHEIYTLWKEAKKTKFSKLK